MRSLSVVLIAPSLDQPTRLVERPEIVLVEQLVAEPAIEALDEDVLHRPPWRDVVKTNLSTMVVEPRSLLFVAMHLQTLSLKLTRVALQTQQAA